MKKAVRRSNRKGFYYKRSAIAVFSPLSLAPLVWFDPSDLTTLFQERTGASATTPAAVDGVVGTMLDKSGNGHHAVAPADAARPILRQSASVYWLEFDGSDDVLTALFALAQPWDRVSLVRQVSYTFPDNIFADGDGNAGQLFQSLVEPELALFDLGAGAAARNSDAVVGSDVVIVERHDGASSRLGVDDNAYTTGDPGTQAAAGMSIGAFPDSSRAAEMRFYGSVVTDRAMTDGEVEALKAFFLTSDLLVGSHGDSISLLLGSENYLPVLGGLIEANRNEAALVKMRGTSGISWDYDWSEDPGTTTMIEEAPSVIDGLLGYSAQKWLIVFAGTNGMVLGAHSAATEYADFKTYVAARIAAGWSADRVVVCTMLPRTGFSNATRDTYNTALVDDDGGYGYRVARLDLDPDIGADGQDEDTDWFSDGVHPTAAGQTRIAEIIYDVMFL